ncbi:zinc finger CCCH domain-containing protein 20 [Prunus yedoensis var. nudiflora]|uniref:Zinc finger CCCH domain-containing protein 20 n=1 Tax=Prunus yedoensis var. nudiflora TaxID=2094558 RepID=A0A314Z192_PRUYE|nr:zinc finger CCCH domain-containing protein 20 [Prunus yedoensis var. nudiflora]
MMLGEPHRPNPTVHVPPWLQLDDPTAEVYSPFPLSGVSVNSEGNANGADYNSPYYLHEALTTFQRYLPSNETDPDSDSDISVRESDSPVDAYSCDHFRMFEFKVRRCARGRSHDWTECPYAHPGRRPGAATRESITIRVRLAPISERVIARKAMRASSRTAFSSAGSTRLAIVRSRVRTARAAGDRGCCLVWEDAAFSVIHTRGVAGNIPTGVSDDPVAESVSGFELRQRSGGFAEELAAWKGQVLAFFLECSGGFFRVWVSGISWSTRVNSSPGFCSLPSTPTRVPGRSGIGYLDFCEEGCEEEPAMERVESGRGLRAKMFERLREENSLGRVESGPSGGAPDVGWVSELVK